jgi:hypothetical protein
MEYVGSGTNYNALPWNGGVPVPANQRVELNNGRVFGATINERGDFEVGDGIFSIDGTTGSATINTSEFNLSGLNFVGPFSRNGGFSTVGVQLREVSDNTSLIASTGAADGNTVPTQSAVKSYVDSTTVQSVDLSVPTGFTSSGGPITGSGSITLAYDSGYQGFTTTEATKLSGIAAGAEVNVQSDWNAVSGDALILNKPTIPSGDLVDDTTPQLGGDLDVQTYAITTSVTDGDIDLDANAAGLIKVTEYNLSQVPIVTQHDIGTAANEIPLSGMLGTMAFQDATAVSVDNIVISNGVLVADLPAGPVGMIARVTDATTPAVGSTVAGGGAAAALCWYNGTNWTVLGV